MTSVLEGIESEKSEEACATTLEDGIEELASSLRIFPNPANDRLYIETQTLTQTLTVEIYDAFGRLQSTVNGQQSLSIDVSGLNAGIYIIKINSNEGNIVKQFIKQ